MIRPSRLKSGADNAMAVTGDYGFLDVKRQPSHHPLDDDVRMRKAICDRNID